MKLGVCYMVFDGEELLEFSIKSIRNVVDFISVTYQNISYFGNKSDSLLLETLNYLKSQKLIDELIFYETDLSKNHKENELNLRNLGLQASINNNCTHHISLDVDELFKENQFNFAKEIIKKGKYDCTIVPMLYYYKNPTYLVWPPQDLYVSFINSTNTKYDNKISFEEFPFLMETTRRIKNASKIKVFDRSEIEMHHMSYVRKDIMKKFNNSDNARFYNLKNFINNYNKYKVGNRLVLLPDYLNRKTILVDNYFNINI